jgi:hypothetical protein
MTYCIFRRIFFLKQTYPHCQGRFGKVNSKVIFFLIIFAAILMSRLRKREAFKANLPTNNLLTHAQ